MRPRLEMATVVMALRSGPGPKRNHPRTALGAESYDRRWPWLLPVVFVAGSVAAAFEDSRLGGHALVSSMMVPPSTSIRSAGSSVAFVADVADVWGAM
jgi:hypothetical protein